MRMVETKCEMKPEGEVMTTIRDERLVSLAGSYVAIHRLI